MNVQAPMIGMQDTRPLECTSLIAGDRVRSGSGEERRNPSDTSEVVSLAFHATAQQVEDAVAAARAAFPAWAELTPQARADMLDRVGSLILARHGELAALLAREEGKTLPEARAEVTKSAQLFKFFAGEALRLGGRHVRSLRERIEVDVVREPVGVAALVTPWNFPLSIPAWKLAPALAYGNCAILKPSELTSGCAQLLSEILVDAGIPAGVFQMVLGGGDVGSALVAHPGVDLVSFTGSSATGRAIARLVEGRQAQLQLELGGKNPLIVMADADLDAALDAAAKGAFYSTGQRCTASSRIIVEEPVADRFTSALLSRVQALEVGHALAAASQIGPLVSERQLDGVQASLLSAQDAGSELAWGGERLERPTAGHFMAPALFVDTKPDEFVNRHEIFGPVASVLRASGLDEAIAIANDTPYGLSAGIYTASHAAMTAFRRRSTAGMLMINLQTVGTDYHVPFGGNGESGYGVREMGPEVASFFTRSRTIYTAG
jgi:acyl-CoA reductase-like NAD-dependent aldehyde dehydrogenase